jgi:hypothetical protein
MELRLWPAKLSVTDPRERLMPFIGEINNQEKVGGARGLEAAQTNRGRGDW